MKKLLFYLIMLILIACSNTQSLEKIKIPNNFLNGDTISLGENFSELIKKKSIRMDNSTENYILTLSGSSCFRTIYFDSKNNILHSVLFERFFNKSDLPIDSVAHEIIKICTKEYGNEYVISEVEISGLKVPAIIWEIKQIGFAVFKYIPSMQISSITDSKKFIPLIMSLEVTYDKQKNYVNSSLFNKNNLNIK